MHNVTHPARPRTGLRGGAARSHERQRQACSKERLWHHPDDERDAQTNEDCEPATQERKVAESVAASRKHHEVGLIPDGRGKGRRGAEHHGEHELCRPKPLDLDCAQD
eukprot:scaffold3818_cov132-Isochrysis_galbana.AAC.5